MDTSEDNRKPAVVPLYNAVVVMQVFRPLHKRGAL